MKSQVFAVVISALGLATAAGPALRNGGITIGDRFYYASPTTSIMNQAQATAYCAGEGGELGKILNLRTYTALRAGLSAVGNYWIDGIETTPVWNVETNKNCSSDDIDLTGVPRAGSRLPVCFALSKTTLATTSGILGLSCEQRLRAVCSINLVSDCVAPTTTAPGTP